MRNKNFLFVNLAFFCLFLNGCVTVPETYVANGFSKFTNDDGSYEGYMQEAKPHGQGKFVFNSGCVYKGQWTHGYINGQGETFCPLENGKDVYKGGYKNGRKHGFGVRIVESPLFNSSLSGQYSMDLPQGKFEYKFKGEIKGEIGSEKINVDGKMTVDFVDGKSKQLNYYTSTYTGEVTYDSPLTSDQLFGGAPHSVQGVEYAEYTNGRKGFYRLEGTAKNGIFFVSYPDNSFYIGSFQKNNFEPNGIKLYADGTKHFGKFSVDIFKFSDGVEDIKRNGIGVVIKENKAENMGIWEKDIRIKDAVIDTKTFLRDFKNLEESFVNLSSDQENFFGSKKAKQVKRADRNQLLAVSSGTGFMVSKNGHLITNNHVIQGCQEVRVSRADKTVKLKVVKSDKVNDIALLKGNLKPKKIFSFSKKDPKLLQEIYVAGYPFGKSLSSSVKVTKGIVSSLSGLGDNYSQIQIDAAIQPGNSGGPILNKNGKVVGVAVSKLDAKMVLKNFGVIPEDTNFGIKSNVVINMLNSNNIPVELADKKITNQSQLADLVTEGTYFLSCLMTYAQIEDMREKKVMFEDIK